MSQWRSRAFAWKQTCQRTFTGTCVLVARGNAIRSANRLTGARANKHELVAAGQQLDATSSTRHDFASLCAKTVLATNKLRTGTLDPIFVECMIDHGQISDFRRAPA